MCYRIGMKCQKNRKMFAFKPAFILLAVLSLFPLKNVLAENNSDIENGSSNSRVYELETTKSCQELLNVEHKKHSRKFNKHFKVGGSNGKYFVIYRGGNLEPPVHAVFVGLDLVDIRQDDKGRRHAVFQVGPELLGNDESEMLLCHCKKNDLLPFNVRILSVKDNIVISFYENELIYFSLEENQDEVFHMVWQSPWTVKRNRQTSSNKRKYKRKKRRHRRR